MIHKSAQPSLFSENYNPYCDGIDPKDFLKKVEKVGIKSFSKIPYTVLKDEEIVKKLIKIDEYSLFYLPNFYHTDEFFMEIEKHHEILLLSPINKKLTSITINWIVDNCSDYVYFDYLKNSVHQINSDNNLLKEKIGLGFLIKNIPVPKYLKSNIEKYNDKNKFELIKIKKSLTSYEQMALFLEEKHGLEIKTKI